METIDTSASIGNTWAICALLCWEPYRVLRYLYYVCLCKKKILLQKKSPLWTGLVGLSASIQEPWVLSGNFNTLLSSDDILGSSVTPVETPNFKDCLDHLQITPLRSKGSWYSFCNKQEQHHWVFSRIDWALGNYQWLQRYGAVEANYLQPGISDHSLILMQCIPRVNNWPKPVKLYSTVMQHHKFLDIVVDTWAYRYDGTIMYQLA